MHVEQHVYPAEDHVQQHVQLQVDHHLSVGQVAAAADFLLVHVPGAASGISSAQSG